MADNAVLILAIAIVKSQGSAKLVPFLQESFVLPFILLAPFVGQIADGFPKGRVMLLANLLKLTGAAVMAVGLNPLLAYNLIGIGAALYSPAKYGILSQMFKPDKLVNANGLLEGSTIAAILLGVLLGGWLADHSLVWAFAGILASYVLAACANLLIPRLAAERPFTAFRPGELIGNFIASLRTMFSDPDSRFSLFGTSIFWGSGVTLRLMLFVWVPIALSISDNQTPANLMGIVSIGIVLGAAAAGIWISLARADRALIGGILLGPVILTLAPVQSYTMSSDPDDCCRLMRRLLHCAAECAASGPRTSIGRNRKCIGCSELYGKRGDASFCRRVFNRHVCRHLGIYVGSRFWFRHIWSSGGHDGR